MRKAITTNEDVKAALQELSDEIVTVRRQWNDWREGKVPLSKLSGFHWSQVSGGVQATANRPYVHAYMWCDALVSGEVAHSCCHGKGPHHIQVCIIKKVNPKTHHVMKAAADLEAKRREVPSLFRQRPRSPAVS